MAFSLKAFSIKKTEHISKLQKWTWKPSFEKTKLVFVEKLKSTKDVRVRITGLEKIKHWAQCCPAKIRILLVRNIGNFTIKQTTHSLWQDCNAANYFISVKNKRLGVSNQGSNSTLLLTVAPNATYLWVYMDTENMKDQYQKSKLLKIYVTNLPGRIFDG